MNRISAITRLEKLESMSIPPEKLCIVHSIVRADNGKPAEIQPEPLWAEVKADGETWSVRRNPGESVEAFEKRVTIEAERRSTWVSTVMLKYSDDEQPERKLA